MNFIETVFDEDGKYRDIDYFTNKGKPCDWCEFKQRGLCSVGVNVFIFLLYLYILIYK